MFILHKIMIIYYSILILNIIIKLYLKTIHLFKKVIEKQIQI